MTRVESLLRNRWAVALASFAVLVTVGFVACGGGGGDDTQASSTTSQNRSTTTQRSNSTTTSTKVLDPGDLPVTLTSDVIWLRTDVSGVCSPAEPAITVLEVDPPEGVERVRARFTLEGDSKNREIELSTTDEGTWRAVIGPIEAKRTSEDRTVVIEAMGESRGADPIVGRVALDLLAPQRCEPGESSRRKTPTAPSAMVRTEPADGVFIASGADDCAARPTDAKVQVGTDGPIVAVELSVTKPDGEVVTRALSGGPARWRTTVGPFRGSPSMPDSTPLTASIAAHDSAGGTTTVPVALTLARPAPCADGSTPTTQPTTATTRPPRETTTTSRPPTTTVPLRLQVRAAPDEVDAVVTGACPTRPTTLVVEARTTGDVRGVRVRVELATGQRQDLDLVSQGGGLWTVEVGPFSGTPSMPATSKISIAARAIDGTGAGVDAAAEAVLHRPPRC